MKSDFVLKLKSTAGTGSKILSNWSSFKFELRERYDNEDSVSYIFDVSFNNQSGHMTVVVKDGIISQDTLLLLSDFDKTLAAYNDTSNFTDGLYEVGKKMLNKIGEI